MNSNKTQEDHDNNASINSNMENCNLDMGTNEDNTEDIIKNRAGIEFEDANIDMDDSSVVEGHHPDNDKEYLQDLDQALEEMHNGDEPIHNADNRGEMAYITDDESVDNDAKENQYDEDVVPVDYNTDNEDNNEDDHAPPL